MRRSRRNIWSSKQYINEFFNEVYIYNSIIRSSFCINIGRPLLKHERPLYGNKWEQFDWEQLLPPSKRFMDKAGFNFSLGINYKHLILPHEYFLSYSLIQNFPDALFHLKQRRTAVMMRLKGVEYFEISVSHWRMH